MIVGAKSASNCIGAIGRKRISMNNSNLLIYQSPDGRIKVDVRLEDETVWLTQDHMAELFGKSKKTISEHIRNVFAEGELNEQVVVRKFRTTTRHGAMPDKTQSRDVQFYNLDVIISVGYRVKSHQGAATDADVHEGLGYSVLMPSFASMDGNS